MTVANRDSHGGLPLRGNLLRHAGGREIAIYYRDGAVLVAELDGRLGRVCALGAWFSVHGRALVYAQRRGEVEIVEPIPPETAERIELLHRAPDARHGSFAMRVAVLAARLRNCFTRYPERCPAR